MDFWRSIYWHQGQFLQPQHFQYNDLAMVGRIQNVQRLSGPHPWGVVNLKIDQTAKSSGVLDLSRGEFVFPDGTFIAINKNALLTSRNFLQGWEDRRQPQRCYIGIKRNNKSK